MSVKAAEIIDYLRSNDFEIKADGEYIDLSPAEKVTDKLIQRLRKHKPEILKELRAESQRKLEKIRAWLISIGEPEDDFYIVFDKCLNDPKAMSYYLEKVMKYEQDKRAKKALAMLESHPDKLRAYTSDTETDPDNVILTCAIRDVATFEILIARDKYDPFLLTEIIHRDLVH